MSTKVAPLQAKTKQPVRTLLSEMEQRNDELHAKHREHMQAAQEVEKEIKKLEPALEQKRYEFARRGVDDAVQELDAAMKNLETRLRTSPAFAKAMSPAMAAMEQAVLSLIHI